MSFFLLHDEIMTTNASLLFYYYYWLQLSKLLKLFNLNKRKNHYGYEKQVIKPPNELIKITIFNGDATQLEN